MFVTLDIETLTLANGEMLPYCICLCYPQTISGNNYVAEQDTVLKKFLFFFDWF